MAIRILCITDGGDRPTVATFIGLHQAGIKVSVVCPPDHPNAGVLEAHGVPVLNIGLTKNFDRAGRTALRKELIRGDYQLIHTFNSRALTNGLHASKGLPVKVIAYRGIVGNLSVLDPMSWQRYLNPRIDKIVCVADAIRVWFLQMQPAFLRVPSSRLLTIHKGHKLEWYNEPPVELARIGIPPDAFTIACTAAYRPRKGIEFLIDAIEQMPGDIPAHLVLVGNMAARKLTNRISRSPARARIHRTGYQSNAPAWSAAADVFCLPSVKREGLPRAVIEAMAYGVPPVVTNSGGSPELVVDGISGYVVPVRDAAALAERFTQLYRNPALRNSMGAAARQRIATDFRIEDTVRKTVALYRELVHDTEEGQPWPQTATT